MSDDPSSGIDRRQLLVLDASIMINFFQVNAWPSLLRLPGFKLASPRIVTEQLVKDRRRAAIRDAVASGSLQLVDETIPPQLLTVFAEWVRRFGEQDTAVLVNALVLDAWIGADDRGLCNEAQRHGIIRIVGTEWLLAEIVQQGQISLPQGNSKMRTLRDARFLSQHRCLCSLCGVVCSCRKPQTRG